MMRFVDLSSGEHVAASGALDSNVWRDTLSSRGANQPTTRLNMQAVPKSAFDLQARSCPSASRGWARAGADNAGESLISSSLASRDDCSLTTASRSRPGVRSLRGAVDSHGDAPPNQFSSYSGMTAARKAVLVAT